MDTSVGDFNSKTHETVKWRNLVVGDIVKVEKDQFFPADLILLQTSDKKGRAYVETKNLDGETNLKNKTINKKIKELLNSFKESDLMSAETVDNYLNNLRDLNLQLFYEAPTNLLYVFKGYLNLRYSEVSNMDHFTKHTFGPEEEARTEREILEVNNSQSSNSSLEEKNILLRGSLLRNTDYIYGLVVYTGHDTKIMMNSTKAKPKKSKLEEQLNIYIILIFGLVVFFCSLGSLMNIMWQIMWKTSSEYMLLDNKNYAITFFQRLGNWILIFGNLVPISLMVSLEGVKFIQAIIISKDKKLLTLKDNMYCDVQSSNLNEELGQIEYIFSDKTGTLTCNEMVFRKLAIGSEPFGITLQKETESEISQNKTSIIQEDVKSKF